MVSWKMRAKKKTNMKKRKKTNTTHSRRTVSWGYYITIIFIITISINQVFRIVRQEEIFKTFFHDATSKVTFDDNSILAASSSKVSTKDNESNNRHHRRRRRRLKIVWLMSFPNSGTTFTLSHVKGISKNLVGTNYVHEASKQGEPLSIFDDHKETNNKTGPFWLLRGDATFPDEYVLTKTHCVEHLRPCDGKCLSKRIKDFPYQCTDPRHKEYHQYSLNDVKKAIHLIRNPFDNIISQVHHHISHQGTALLKSNETDTEQFIRVCNLRYKRGNGPIQFLFDDTTNNNEQLSDKMTNNQLLQILDDVPCLDFFLSYVTWHNMAFTTTEKMDLDTLVFHYESYEGDESQLQNVTSIILDFLNYTQVAKVSDVSLFHPKKYINFFTIDQKQAVQLLMKKMSSKRTWKSIKRYFHRI